MDLQAVIFDMDGLLIDSEPLWEMAGTELLNQFGFQLSTQQYHSSTGLRTREWLAHWFLHFKINENEIPKAEETIIKLVIEKIKQHGKMMSGVHYIINYFLQKNIKLGIATSSPMELANVVLDIFNFKPVMNAVASAGNLPYGKPHPQVYINCADMLGVAPANCLCFEDSFNGLLAAKAAKMRCVIVPAQHQNQDPRWVIADLKISSLQNFNDLLLGGL